MKLKNRKDISSEVGKFFQEIKKLPKINCIRCGVSYRGHETEKFICFKCKEKIKMQIEAEDRKQSEIKYLLQISNIPIRYEDANFKAKTEIQLKVSKYFIENFSQKNLKESSDILLFGSIGTGKTYISCAFALELIRKEQKHVKYVTEYELLSFYFEKEYQKFRNCRNSEILILDEIGKRVLVDWQRIQLEELLSFRYNNMLPTIYITNLEQNQFKEFLGDRLADRLRENKIQRFAFYGESLR